MSKLRRLLSGLVLTLPLIVGYNFHVTAAKQASAPRQTVEKLPPDTAIKGAVPPGTFGAVGETERDRHSGGNPTEAMVVRHVCRF